MSPIHWVASNGPMPERIPAVDAEPDPGVSHSNVGESVPSTVERAPGVAERAADTTSVNDPGGDGHDNVEESAASSRAQIGGVHGAVSVHFDGASPANAVAVGIDAVDVPRLAAVLERTPAMRERCFTTIELVDAATGGDEIGHLAVCFAAKEAVAKALGCGLGPVGFHDIELRRSGSGAPALVLTGAAASLAESAGMTSWLVSAQNGHS